MSNLLLQLDEKHPRFQELADINDCLMQDLNLITHHKFNEALQQQMTQSKGYRTHR